MSKDEDFGLQCCPRADEPTIAHQINRQSADSPESVSRFAVPAGTGRWKQNFPAATWLWVVWRDEDRITGMHKSLDRSEIILNRINDIFAGEATQDVLNAIMATLVSCVLAQCENDREYPHEFVEDLLTRIRALCLQEWIRDSTN